MQIIVHTHLYNVIKSSPHIPISRFVAMATVQMPLKKFGRIAANKIECYTSGKKIQVKQSIRLVDVFTFYYKYILMQLKWVEGGRGQLHFDAIIAICRLIAYNNRNFDSFDIF